MPAFVELTGKVPARFPAHRLMAIASARVSVRVETYIYEAEGIGTRILAALVAAARRGARVQVLVDAFGSQDLGGDFWGSLRAAGGEVRVFNPMHLARFGIRNHRKLVVCDDAVALVGGFNIASEYEGDGVGREALAGIGENDDLVPTMRKGEIEAGGFAGAFRSRGDFDPSVA